MTRRTTWARRAPAAGAAAVLLALSGCITINTPDDGETTTGGPASASATPVEETPTPTPSPTVAQTRIPPSASDLAAAVVEVIQTDAVGNPACLYGSGSVVDPTGLILTNAHVVTPGEGCEDGMLKIAVTTDADRPPDVTYVAELVAVDEALDLAVLQITTDLAGNPIDVYLPALAVGDSDTVELGQDLRILGYPGIGGDTITYTTGSVAGFTAEASVGERAWIKTDATIAGGNSGGSAVDAEGRLVAVPTKASGREDGDITDCRVVQDTNDDGTVDELDTCIPIGGFINGLRPVNLALGLIEQGRAGDVVEPAAPDVVPVSATFSGVTFSAGIAGDQAAGSVAQLPSGSTEVCGSWDYTGMADGAVWDAIWLVDGEPEEDLSTAGQDWAGGESGSWWVCAQNASGLDDGPYELQLFVNGELASAGSVHVGDGYTPLDLTVTNASADQICLLYLSPSTAEQWGADRLGAGVLDAGGSVMLRVVDVPYDLRAWDCSDTVVDERYQVDVGAGSLVLGQG